MRDATECNAIAAQRIAMHHNAAQCCARYHNAVECRAKQRSTMQQNQHCYSATRCSAMRHNAMKRGGMHDESSVATRCIARTRFMFNGTHDFLTSRHSFSLSLSLSLGPYFLPRSFASPFVSPFASTIFLFLLCFLPLSVSFSLSACRSVTLSLPPRFFRYAWRARNRVETYRESGPMG